MVIDKSRDWKNNTIQTEIEAMGDGKPHQKSKEYYQHPDRSSWREVFNKFEWKDKDVLEIGAFAGWLGHKVQSYGARVLITDIYVHCFPDFLDGCYADKGNLPFEDEQYDYVICRDTLHHGDLDSCVSEAYRVLKCMGVFIAIREPCIHSSQDEDTVLLRDCSHCIFGGIMEHRPNMLQYVRAFEVFDEVEMFNAVTLESLGDHDYGESGISIIGKKR